MKKMIAMLFTLTLLLSLGSASFALGAVTGADYVTDKSDLLTAEELATLSEEAAKVSEQYECGVYIYILNDFTEEALTDDLYEGAKDIYITEDMGYGEEKSGVLLLMSTDDRDFALMAFGYGNTAFTDYGKKELKEEFLDNFRDDDWYGGFTDYIDKSAEMLEMSRAGNPLDVGSSRLIKEDSPLKRAGGGILSVISGFVLSLLGCATISSRKKKVRESDKADAYFRADKAEIVTSEDNFLYVTQVRTKVDDDSFGSSGGTTIDSDGFSGTTGKY